MRRRNLKEKPRSRSTPGMLVAAGFPTSTAGLGSFTSPLRRIIPGARRGRPVRNFLVIYDMNTLKVRCYFQSDNIAGCAIAFLADGKMHKEKVGALRIPRPATPSAHRAGVLCKTKLATPRLCNC